MNRFQRLFFPVFLLALISCAPSPSQTSKEKSESVSSFEESGKTTPDVFYAEKEPSSSARGDIWIVPSSGNAYQKYEDGWFLAYNGEKRGVLASFDYLGEDTFSGKAQKAFARVLFCTDLEYRSSFAYPHYSDNPALWGTDLISVWMKTHRGVSIDYGTVDTSSGGSTESSYRYAWFDEKGRARHYWTSPWFEANVKNKTITEEGIALRSSQLRCPAAFNGLAMRELLPQLFPLLEFAMAQPEFADENAYIVSMPENDNGLANVTFRFDAEERYIAAFSLLYKNAKVGETFPRVETYFFDNVNEGLSVAIPERIIEKEAALMKEVGYFQD